MSLQFVQNFLVIRAGRALFTALYISEVKSELISIISHRLFLVLSKNSHTHKFAEYKVSVQNHLNVYIPAQTIENKKTFK